MRISIILEALTAQFETDLKRAQKATDRAFREIKKSANELNRNIGNALTGAAVVAAAGVAYAVKSAVDQMDALSKSAQKIGVTTEALSALEYAASLADVSLNSLVSSLGKLAKSQVAAVQDPKGNLAQAFRDLNVEIRNTDGSLRSSDAVFADLADRFAAMRDGPEKAALAMQLLGKAGKELIPLLNGGAAAIRAATEEARDFGLIVSTEAGLAAEQFNDDMTRLAAAGRGASIELATYLLPTLTELSDEVVQMARDPAFQQDLANAIKVIGELAISTARGITSLANAAGYLYDEWQQLRGVVDDDDLVRLDEELTSARESLAKLKGEVAILPDPGEIWATPIVLKVDDSLIRPAEERVRALEQAYASALARAGQFAGLDPINLATLPQRRQGAAPRVTDTSEAARAAKDAEREARRQAKEFADDQKEYTRTVRDLKLRALGEEAQALQALQDDYADLNKAIELGVVSQQEAAEIAKGLSAQWQKDASESLRVELLTDEQRAVEELQAKYLSLQNQIATGAITPEMGASRAAGLAEQWAEEEAQRYQSQIDSLSSGLLTEEEMIAQSYDRRRDEIVRALEQEGNAKLERQQELNDLLYKNEEAHTQAVADLERSRQQEKLAIWGEAFGNLATLMSSENEKLFRIGQAAAVAEAVVNIAQGVTEALALGPIAGPVLAATVAAAGAVQIGTILSQSPPQAYDAGGTIPAGGWGIVGEKGPELVSGRATVIGRAATAALMKPAAQEPMRIRNVFVFDINDLGNALASSDAGERMTVHHVNRNRSALGIQT